MNPEYTDLQSPKNSELHRFKNRRKNPTNKTLESTERGMQMAIPERLEHGEGGRRQTGNTSTLRKKKNQSKPKRKACV